MSIISLTLIMMSWGLDRPLGTGSAPTQHAHARAEDCVCGDRGLHGAAQACELSEMPQACVLGEGRATAMCLSKSHLPGSRGRMDPGRMEGWAGQLS